MNRAAVVCTLCAILSSSWLESVEAQLRSEQDSGSIVQSIETLSKVVEGLQTEIKMQSSVLSNLVSKEELESILLNNLATKSDMQIHETSFKSLETRAAMHDNSLSNLQATVDELKVLLIKVGEKEDERVTPSRNLEAQSSMQTILLDEVAQNLENQTSLRDNFLTKMEVQVNNLTKMESKGTTVSDELETLAEGIQNSTAPKGIVEGIIAGTIRGVVIIPLDSRKPRSISSKDTDGVAFNWQSRKVYWIESNVGIKTANIDGSDSEVLISDRYLGGLAVDQITGNLYYGKERGDHAIMRVCDSMGRKCVSFAPGVNSLAGIIRDIALFPSQGIMFWSITSEKESVIRANMDGTNATEIIVEPINGLYLDEFTEKLYWASLDDQSIGHHDINGYNRNVLLNTKVDPLDIAVDGDTLYFGGFNPNGVYSATSNGQVSSIANTTAEVLHIAFFGRHKTFSRPNPCKDSPCANLCVLDRVGYTCL